VKGITMKKGFIINNEFVENPNGNFYTFDSTDDLKNFLDNVPAHVVDSEDDEEMECKACGASMTEIELWNNGNRCWVCETPWNLL
jgi:hypothetical protein